MTTLTREVTSGGEQRQLPVLITSLLIIFIGCRLLSQIESEQSSTERLLATAADSFSQIESDQSSTERLLATTADSFSQIENGQIILKDYQQQQSAFSDRERSK